MYRTVGDFFNILNSKFRPEHNETILLLQYCKVCRCDNDNAEEWLDRPHIMTTNFKCKEINRHLIDQFINSLNDDGMIVEIICKCTSLSDTSSVMREQVLTWARRVEAQRTQNAMLDILKKNEFYAVQSYKAMVNPITKQKNATKAELYAINQTNPKNLVLQIQPPTSALSNIQQDMQCMQAADSL